MDFDGFVIAHGPANSLGCIELNERFGCEGITKNPEADPEEIVRICCEIVYDDIIEYAQERIKDNE